MSLEPLLEMQGISKTFNGLRVLKSVGLKVFPGEIHALMGENGAGKSTLMKILSGAYQADPGGEIRIDGQSVPTFTPATAKAFLLKWGIRLTQVPPRGCGQDASGGTFPPTILWRGVGAVQTACSIMR